MFRQALVINKTVMIIAEEHYVIQIIYETYRF